MIQQDAIDHRKTCREIELARRVVKKVFDLTDEQSVRLVKDMYKLTSNEIIELYGIWIV